MDYIFPHFAAEEWGPERFNILLKVTKVKSSMTGILFLGSLVPQCTVLTTVTCCRSVWKASEAWRALWLFWDPFEQVLERLVYHCCLLRSWPGPDHEWVESRNVCSGSCSVSDFAPQSDTLESLQTFQTTQDSAASQPASSWFYPLSSLPCGLASVVIEWSLVSVFSVECRLCQSRAEAVVSIAVSLVPSVAAGQGTHVWKMSIAVTDLLIELVGFFVWFLLW